VFRHHDLLACARLRSVGAGGRRTQHGATGSHPDLEPIRVPMLSSMTPGEIIGYPTPVKALPKDVKDDDIMFARPGPRG